MYPIDYKLSSWNIFHIFVKNPLDKLRRMQQVKGSAENTDY